MLSARILLHLETFIYRKQLLHDITLHISMAIRMFGIMTTALEKFQFHAVASNEVSSTYSKALRYQTPFYVSEVACFPSNSIGNGTDN